MATGGKTVGWGANDLSRTDGYVFVALFGLSGGLRRREPGGLARRRDLEGMFLRRAAGRRFGPAPKREPEDGTDALVHYRAAVLLRGL